MFSNNKGLHPAKRESPMPTISIRIDLTKTCKAESIEYSKHNLIIIVFDTFDVFSITNQSIIIVYFNIHI